MAELQELTRRQRYLRTSLARVQRAKDAGGMNANEIQIQLGVLEELKDRSAEVETDMLLTLDEDQWPAQERVFDEIFQTYCELKAALLALVPPANVAAAVPEGREQERPRGGNNVKLPKLEIPKFSGDLLEWMSFHDRFVAAVHGQNIPGSTKLLYLKDALVGEAGDVLRCTSTTDENYAEAWAAVVKRFKNVREIAKAHLDRMADMPSVMGPLSQSLRKMVDVTNECIRSLKALGLPTEHWDVIIAHSILRKVDQETKQQWEMKFLDDSFPVLNDLLEFLDRRSKALAVSEDPVQSTTKKYFGGQNFKAAHVGVKSDPCACCEENHPLHKCPKFVALSVEDRNNLVKSKRLCFNCLKSFHRSTECTFRPCTKCNSRHNDLLHFERASQQQEHVSHVVEKSVQRSNTLLATAIIKVRDARGDFHEVRALLDNCSQLTLITEDCVQRLGLKKHNSSTSVTGVGAVNAGGSKGVVNFILSSRVDETFHLNVEGLVLTKITSDQPNFTIADNGWSHIKDLPLADPEFRRSARIDVLLGGDVLAEVMEEGLVKSSGGSPTAQKTALGWILFGSVNNGAPKVNRATLLACCNLEKTVQSFFASESDEDDGSWKTEEEDACEEHFQQTLSRHADGRYVVRLPFKKSPDCLGDSRKRALRTLLQSEKRLTTRGMLEQYNNVLQEYIDMGHMELVSGANLHAPGMKYYLAHHGVIKEDSTTTKLRVVFNASASTTTGESLNSILRIGTRIQEDLFSILVRARQFPIMMTADVAKMYRQVWVHSEDRDFQRILWRPTLEEPIKEYRLKTVTFGVASAPFQAIRAMQQLAHDYQDKFPLAAAILLRDFYVDDVITGQNSIEEALEVQRQLIALCNEGGFPLRKWSSNETALLESLSADMRETKLPLTLDSDDKIKTLGLRWSPGTDQFSFLVKIPAAKEVTKRSILSGLAKVFDPLGWLSPLTVRAKILFQSLWKLNLDWDTAVPPEVETEWVEYLNDLKIVSDLKIDRFACLKDFNIAELIGFCDSSEKAMAAAVFIRTVDDNKKSKTALLAAKTKLVPIRKTSIPKLELCATVLLSKLIDSVKRALQLDVATVKCYTDSSIVMTWLSSPPSRWRKYVERRVEKVQHLVPAECWHHVPGVENPADCGSRGIKASHLLLHPLWWTAPAWVNVGGGPGYEPPEENVEALQEEKRAVLLVTTGDFISRFSSYAKLLRITAFIIRAMSNRRVPSTDRKSGPYTSCELKVAELRLVRWVQMDSFGHEYALLTEKKELSVKNHLLRLSPMMDQDGVMRVGGRLENAQVHADMKHPMLLPKRHPLTILLVRHEHGRNSHPGSEQLLATIGQRFWIMGGRDVVRRISRQCIKCQRFNAKTAEQFMANLPAVRVNETDVFGKVGVDYTGPVILKNMTGRSRLRSKGYICLFICMATRSIHLELVSDLSTEKCVAAIRRFVSRRGSPRVIFSDC